MSVALRWLGKQRGRISLGMAVMGWAMAILLPAYFNLLPALLWPWAWLDFWRESKPDFSERMWVRYYSRERQLLEATCPNWEPTDQWTHAQLNQFFAMAEMAVRRWIVIDRRIVFGGVALQLLIGLALALNGK